MGMDIYGTNPKKEYGKYFRNNVTAWNPLWETVCEITGEVLTKEQKAMGHHNDNIEITKKQTKKMIKKIELFFSEYHLEKETNIDSVIAIMGASLEVYYKEFQNIARYPHIIAIRDSLNIQLTEDIKSCKDFTENFLGFYIFLQSCGGFKIS